ncbi:MAG: hypothetical protein IJV06_10635 [Bacteroidaceae bacterium]|nr:hypothetical protein [Bacteroidaceae bacterium]
MKKRNPYADVGLMVAVAVFVVVLIKCLIFGLSWASIACFVFTAAYFLVSALRKSDEPVVRRATTAYLLLMLLLVVSLVLFDKNARPKMHAFEGAAVDTLAEEEFVVEDKEIPVEIVQPDTAETDSLSADTAVTEPLPTEGTEPVALPTEPADSPEL